MRRAKQAVEDSGQACGAMSGAQRTASSTSPNSSNFWRRVASSVCQARPLLSISTQIIANVGSVGVAYPMKSFVVEVILIEVVLMSIASFRLVDLANLRDHKSKAVFSWMGWKFRNKRRMSLPKTTQVVVARKSLVAKREGKYPSLRRISRTDRDVGRSVPRQSALGL